MDFDRLPADIKLDFGTHVASLGKDRYQVIDIEAGGEHSDLSGIVTMVTLTGGRSGDAAAAPFIRSLAVVRSGAVGRRYT